MPADQLPRARADLARCPRARERHPEAKGCQNGELGKAGLAVLHSLLFDFTNMKTGVCFPRVRTLQEKLQPWYSRASIFRALDRLEAAGSFTRVQAHEERGEGGPGREPLCVRPDHRSRAEDGAEGEGARQGHGARGPAGAMASATIRVSVCAGSFGEPDFLGLKAGKSLP